MRQAVIFKGATRPACIMGVPIVPFVLVCGTLIMLSFIIYAPLVISVVPVVLVLRQIARDDDQRFLQLWLHFKVNVLGCRRQGHAGAALSLAPVSYRRQRGREVQA